jgi:hypothetical protein
MGLLAWLMGYMWKHYLETDLNVMQFFAKLCYIYNKDRKPIVQKAGWAPGAIWMVA